MLAFIFKRLGQSILVMLAVALIAFIMFRYVGDPVASMVSQEASIADQELLRERLGLNDPFYEQFFRFIVNAVQGNFGISYRLQTPVAELVMSRLPATIELALTSATIALVFGILAGVFTALNRKNPAAAAIMAFSLIGVSLPTFLIGIGLIYIFAVELQWLPSFGRGQVIDFGWWTTGFFTETGLRSIILPAITLSLFQMTLIMRLVRAEMLEVLRQDYIKFARARGLSKRAINFSHALKNTMVPVITIAGLQLGSIITGALITETVFQWPGIGSLFLSSVAVVDVPVMAAYLIFVGFVFVVVNLIVDILYYVVDPRLRVGAAKGH
ncbi:ABC transporter permease [Pelagibacterium halotolerans]|uniref:Dipeptide transport system permease protein DppB n=1 Tax=Pelagibacterium halotolerans (strain DSM 22347 / JCM 15775 / CGMCC 1.7692 / B2) TaxID=1082931 RepID=G4REH0_PELHB|nr:ABC transporter permease [Pelagibacterium halotolerans]AEQ53902.1 dipeptide transport system permease protein DppB [Pelagibacterium halotolerans B2]QJR19955.1 ABC transporter permease [Pelagibacterium halotolerans]SEA46177.1 peptide/nickel transport system permease protein/oligopeptide transport system permease protein [Pelagibacterium halotolerans]